MNIRFSGFGGQGIVSAGVILGWAAVFDEKNAIQTQSYGSEARGGSCKSDVIIEEREIYELEPAEIDILFAFSQPAYKKYRACLKPGGMLFIDEDLVKPEMLSNKTYAIPATDIAYKKMKRKIMANQVMLGYFVAKTGLITPGSMKKSISLNVPHKTVQDNLDIFDIGMNLP